MILQQAEREDGRRPGEQRRRPLVDTLDASLDRAGVPPQFDTRVPDRFQQDADLMDGKIRVGRSERVHRRQAGLRFRGVEQPTKYLQDLGGPWSSRLPSHRLAEREDHVETGRRIDLRLPAPHKCRQDDFTGALTDTE
ncbi:hypothetical protein ACFQ0M_00335 [Kitasatospora aburaviensis]